MTTISNHGIHPRLRLCRPEVNAPYLDDSGLSLTSIAFGGTDFMLHRVTIWNAPLTTEESLTLFQGSDTESSLFSDPTTIHSQHLVAALFPDNSGRLVIHEQ